MATCNCMGSLCGKCICACLCKCESTDVSNDWLTYIFESEESLEDIPDLPKR